jgi:uncharacterized membrane protein YccC
MMVGVFCGVAGVVGGDGRRGVAVAFVNTLGGTVIGAVGVVVVQREVCTKVARYELLIETIWRWMTYACNNALRGRRGCMNGGPDEAVSQIPGNRNDSKV